MIARKIETGTIDKVGANKTISRVLKMINMLPAFSPSFIFVLAKLGNKSHTIMWYFDNATYYIEIIQYDSTV